MWFLILVVVVVAPIGIYYAVKSEKATKEENKFLEMANNGNVSAQYSLGQFYLENKNMDKALYWFCVAEYNGYTGATDRMQRIFEIYPDQQALSKRINNAREQVQRNPVRKETMENIINEMKNNLK